MSLFLQILEGCFLLNNDRNPLLPEDQGKNTNPELMPLVKSPHVFADEDYYRESADFYQNVLQQNNMQLELGSRIMGPITFTEYQFKFEPDSDEIRQVYAITGGWLFFIRQGQSYIDLLGDAIPDEDAFLLKSFPAAHAVWRKFYPELLPLLTKTIYLNAYPLINSDLDPNDPITLLNQATTPLITEIHNNLTEEFFRLQFEKVTGSPYSGTEAWDVAYFRLFLNYPGVAIPLSPTAQIGWTRPDPLNPTTQQQLGLSFEINSVWADHSQDLKNFFTYRARIAGQEGHPMLSLLTNTPVIAGFIDYLEPRVHIGGRTKESLNMVEVEDAPLLYHALSIDPDSNPPTLIIQKAPSSDVNAAIITALYADQSDHGTTKLRLRNPLGLPIMLQFAAEFLEASIGEMPLNPNFTFLDVETIISFRATATSQSPLTLSVTTADPSVIILQLQVEFLEFKWVPVRFHLLYDDIRTIEQARASITQEDIRLALKSANYILVRQANTYLVAIEDELGISLDPLRAIGNLGDTIEWTETPNTPLYRVNESLESNPSFRTACNMVLAWGLQGAQEGAAGYVVYKDSYPYFSSIFLSTRYFKGSVLVHELLHWFSIQFHGVPLMKTCGGDAKHYNHGCEGGDTTFYYNLMAPNHYIQGGEFITIRQAKVLNQNISLLITP